MGITSGHCNLCLELLQQLPYSTSEKKYMELYESLKVSALLQVIKYFGEHWHKIRNQWALGMKYSTGNFLNDTDNRPESLNAKLKSVISRYLSLEDFTKRFFLILRVLRVEQDHKASLIGQKVPVSFHSSKDSVSIKYMKYLTPYAYKYFSCQFELKTKVIHPAESTDEHFSVSSNEGTLLVFSSACQCMRWNSMRLPCRHILVVTEKCHLDLFDKSLCDQRWSLAYYRSKQRIFRPEEEVEGCDDHPVEVPVLTSPAPKKNFFHR